MSARAARAGLALLAATAAAVAPWLLDRALALPLAYRIDQALFGVAPDDDRAAPRALPHRWSAKDCGECTSGWYRFEPPRQPPAGEAWALLVPAQGDNVAAYFAGRLLGQGGRFADPVARLGPRPLLASVPAATWGTDEPQFFLMVKAGRAGAGYLPAFALGPEATMRDLAWWREVLVATLPQALAAALAMLGLALGIIGVRRRDGDSGVFAIVSLAWAAFAFATLAIEVPWPVRAWEALLTVMAWGVAATFALQVVRLAAPRVRIRMLVLGAASLALVAAALAALAVAGPPLESSRAIAFLAIAGAGAWLASAMRRHSLPLAVGGVAIAAAGVHDAMAEVTLVLEALPAVPLFLPALLLATGWHLLRRFAETLDAAELLNIDLESLVQARTAELAKQFERVRELERERAVAHERERLMRDMHDGLGGHLVSMLAMLEAGARQPAELARVTRQALDDMRLMIDSLEPVHDDLNAVLAMLRDRLEPRLRAAGVALDWDVGLLPTVPGLTPSRVLHVLRMLQEAVTNAVRHGGARLLRVAASVEDGAIGIEVRDDGCGFDPGAARAGRGLANLRRRAAELGARFAIDSAPGRGTCVSLWLPRSGSGA